MKHKTLETEHPCIVLHAIFSGNFDALINNVSDTIGKDFHGFAPHWIAGIVYKDFPKLKKYLPKNYGILFS